MKKTVRDDRGYPLGYTDTAEKKGTYAEFIDKAGYTHRGYIAETLQSCDYDERSAITEKGELF
jgi:hypothetical protein